MSLKWTNSCELPEQVEIQIESEVNNPVYRLSLPGCAIHGGLGGRFWFDFAARKSFDVETMYQAALHNDGPGVELLDDKMRADMESFTRIKMEHLKAYKEECTARFPSQMQRKCSGIVRYSINVILFLQPSKIMYDDVVYVMLQLANQTFKTYSSVAVVIPPPMPAQNVRSWPKPIFVVILFLTLHI